MWKVLPHFANKKAESELEKMGTSKFTKTHFVTIARIINLTLQANGDKPLCPAFEQLCQRLIDTFSIDNPAFDVKIFCKAAGLEWLNTKVTEPDIVVWKKGENAEYDSQ